MHCDQVKRVCIVCLVTQVTLLSLFSFHTFFPYFAPPYPLLSIAVCVFLLLRRGGGAPNRWLGGYLTQNLQRASSLHLSARSCDAEVLPPCFLLASSLPPPHLSDAEVLPPCPHHYYRRSFTRADLALHHPASHTCLLLAGCTACALRLLYPFVVRHDSYLACARNTRVRTKAISENVEVARDSTLEVGGRR